jgi:DNA-binding phage protein
MRKSEVDTMNGFLVDGMEADPALMKLYLREKLIVEVTEALSRALATRKVSRTELAKRLGATKGRVTQLLDGSANMTLRTISDVLWALDFKPIVSAVPLDVPAEVGSRLDDILSDFDLLMATTTPYEQQDVGEPNEPIAVSADSSAAQTTEGLSYRMVA